MPYSTQFVHDRFLKNKASTTTVAALQTELDTTQALLDDCTQSIVTGSRALGTVYQNTSGKIMIVMVTAAFGAVGDGVIVYIEAGDTTPDTAVAETYGVADTEGAVTFVVAPSSYYKVSAVAGASLVYWTEWTLL